MPLLSRGADSRPQTIEVCLIELDQIKLWLSIKRVAGSRARVAKGMYGRFGNEPGYPSRLLPSPKTNEVVVLLLEKAQVSREIELRRMLINLRFDRFTFGVSLESGIYVLQVIPNMRSS